MPKNNTKKKKEVKPIKAWMYDYGLNTNPSIVFKKPYPSEIKNAKKYNTKVTPVLITPITK